MAHAVDQAGAVAGLLPQDAEEAVVDLALVAPILNLLLNHGQHFLHLDVGAAVTGAFQRAHCGADGGIDIRMGGGEHPAGEGGVVAAAVLCVEHHAQIQQAGFLCGVFVIVPDGVEEVLRRAQTRLGPVQIERAVVKIAVLGGVGVGNDGGAAGDELHSLVQLGGQGQVVGIVVVRIEGQYAAGQLIHNILTGGL